MTVVVLLARHSSPHRQSLLYNMHAVAICSQVSTIQSYVDSFKHGALPHGGGGVGE